MLEAARGSYRRIGCALGSNSWTSTPWLASHSLKIAFTGTVSDFLDVAAMTPKLKAGYSLYREGNIQQYPGRPRLVRLTSKIAIFSSISVSSELSNRARISIPTI